jgi:hypothetical protein
LLLVFKITLGAPPLPRDCFFLLIRPRSFETLCPIHSALFAEWVGGSALFLWGRISRLHKITFPWRTIILDEENAQPEREGRMYSNANKNAAKFITRKALPLPPPYPPGV